MDLNEMIKSKEPYEFENALNQIPKKNRQRFIRARKDGYLVFNARERKINDLYYKYCEESYRPIILVKIHKSQADFRIDMISRAIKNEQVPPALLDVIAKQLNIARKNNDELSPGFVDLKGISQADAEYLAKASARAFGLCE